jgi:hypothetical protein
LNRYPDRQKDLDDQDKKIHGRIAETRPGATLRVKGFIDGEPGPVVEGRALLSKISPGYGEQVLISTPQYGRAWFHLQGHPFRVIEEI